MQTNLNYFSFNILIFFSIFFSVHSQSNENKLIIEKKKENEIDTISKRNDSIANKKTLILDLIKYSAKDSVRINKQENVIFLYNEAILEYQNMTLKSGVILLNYLNNQVYAGRIPHPDSINILTQKPVFTQGRDEINPDSIIFNFDTKKALIWNSKTQQSDMNIFSNYTKKENDSLYYIRNAKVTTSLDPENPEYYIRIRKGKLVPGSKIIASLSNLYVANVPTPVFVPFAYFPAGDSKESGFIFPTFGESNQRGYYLQNMGYYLPFGDFLDLNLTGDYYTNGSYGFRWDSNYKVRYKFSGSFSFRYEKVVNGERGFGDFSKSTVFNARWSHRQDTKSSPYSNFSASVNIGSSDYFRQSINQLNNSNFLNNNMSSSVSYQKTFPKYPRVNISLTTALSQNNNTKTANLTLPTFQGNMERVFPFGKKDGPKKGIIQNINFQLTTLAENRINTTEEKLFKKEMFEDAAAGVRHNIPISTNFKVAKYFSISAGGNYQEIWTPYTIKYNDYSNGIEASKDTIRKFDAFRTYNYSASAGTTLYGIVNFKKGKKIESIRHTIRPSISYNNQPSFEKYYDTYIIDARGNTAEYTRFENALFGSPTKGYSSGIGINLNNSLEAKVKSKDSTSIEPKKITIFSNLNISTSYSISADEFKWSPVRMSTALNFFDKKLATNLNATFDPYGLDENQTRINVLNIKNGGGLLRLTSANMNMNFRLDNDTFKKASKRSERKENEEKEEGILDLSDIERLSGGGRDDDLFGRSNAF